MRRYSRRDLRGSGAAPALPDTLFRRRRRPFSSLRAAMRRCPRRDLRGSGPQSRRCSARSSGDADELPRACGPQCGSIRRVTFKAWALVLSAAVNLYLLGVMVLFASVVYPQFSVTDRAAFTPLYQSFTSRIGAPVVVFELAAFVLTLV